MKLEPPSKEFLEELRNRARHFGWRGDYYEIIRFVEELYEDAGLPRPDLSVIEEDDV
jgi:hypothetical protein